jgi:hypothetical protein
MFVAIFVSHNLISKPITSEKKKTAGEIIITKNRGMELNFPY